MVRYRPPALRSGAFPAGRRELGQVRVSEKVVVVTTVATLAFAGLGIWVGINTGLNEKGVLSAAGWTVAAGSGVFAGLQLAAMLAALAKGGPAPMPGRP